MKNSNLHIPLFYPTQWVKFSLLIFFFIPTSIFAQYNIGGLLTEADCTTLVINNTIDLTGSSIDVQSSNGNYLFTNLPSGGNYTITPSNDTNHLDGVTTYDLILIIQHILGVSQMPNPYCLIAADVNNNGNITTFDVVQLRQLILHTIIDFPANTSWRFIDKSHVFPTPTNPWSNVFPEYIDITNLNGDLTNIDFIGVKTGDVSTYCSPSFSSLSSPIDISATDVSASNGSSVCLDVSADNFNDMTGIQYSMHWDPLLFSFSHTQSFNISDLSAGNFNQVTPGTLAFSWNIVSNGTAGITVPDGTSIYQVCFNVLGNNCEQSSFSFDANPVPLEVSQEDMNPNNSINFSAGNMEISSNCFTCPDPSLFNVYVPNSTTVCPSTNTSVCIPFLVDNFNQILATQWTIEFDPIVLDFDQTNTSSIQNVASGTITLNNGSFNETTPGVVRFAWVDITGASITLPNNSTFFEMCFAPIGTGNSTSSIDITGNATAFEIVGINNNGSTDVISACSTGGDLNMASNYSIEGTIAGNCSNLNNDYTVNLSGSSNSSQTANANYLFDNLTLGDNYTITPNHDINPLNGVSTFDLVLMSQHILGLTEFTNPYQMIAADVNNDGNITTFDIVQTRQLILYLTINFPANTSWRFVDKSYIFPIPSNPWFEVFPESVSINNLTSNLTDLDFYALKIGDVNGDAAGCTINNYPTAFSPAVSANHVNGETGSTICVDVSVDNFSDLTNLQYSMHWDASLFEFSHTQNYNLSDLTSSNFSAFLGNNNTLSLSWSDLSNSPTGISVQNGTSIYQVCFDVLGNNCEQSPFIFDSNPVIALYIPYNMAPSTDIIFSDGSLNISSNCGNCPDSNILNVAIPSTTIICPTTNNGTVCIPFTVQNFNQILSTQWTIEYDPTVLDFDRTNSASIQNVPSNIIAFSSASFNKISPGIVRFGWSDFVNASVTLADGTTYFEMCFDIINTSNSISAINITGNSISSEASWFNSSGQSEIIPLCTAGGTLEIDTACPTCTDGIQNGNETGLDCGGPTCPACPPCLQSYYHWGLIPTNVYQSGSFLGSNGLVESGSNVRFMADHILLDPHFEVELGAEFLAEIVPCINAFNSNSSALQQAESTVLLDETSISINYQLTDSDMVTISLASFDQSYNQQLGKRQLQKGEHLFMISTTELPNGVYFLTLKSEKETKVERIVIP